MSILINDEYHLEYYFIEDFNKLYDLVKEEVDIKYNYDLSVSFVDDKKIKEINRDYRNIDKATDVISFAMLDNEDLVLFNQSELDLGDIFISVDTAKKQALSLNQSLEAEIRFLFVHGLLHLLGYDHMNKEDEEKMFTLQKVIIDEFNKTLI